MHKGRNQTKNFKKADDDINDRSREGDEDEYGYGSWDV